MKTLSFLARGSAMVFDLDAHENGVRRFVGRKHDKAIGFPSKDKDGNVTMSGGWPALHEAQAVSARGEYLLACRNGDLWPADEATAQYCGVKFDPRYGGEHEALKEAKTELVVVTK